jgi:hypothetical protein
MSTPADDLAALREAAGRRDWGALQTLLTRLFMGLDFYAGLEIAVKRAGDHLAVFERQHPDATWARKLLVGIVAYGSAPTELPPEAARPYPSPGAGNFINALFELCRAVERRTPLENRVRFSANAVAHVILAQLAAFWYGEHPDAWARQTTHGDEPDPQTGLTVRQGIYAQFWLDASVATRDTAAWLAVAEAIEEQL